MRIVVGIAVLAPILYGQTSAFEVASVKPTQSNESGRSFTQHPGARLTTTNATVKMLLAFAYQLMPDEITGGPAWIQSDGFDIEAKAADASVTQAQFRQMIRGLLQERFHLASHLETREMQVYVLVQAKNGARLAAGKESDGDAGVRIVGAGRITGVRGTMAMLANVLIKPLQRKVIDQTGLTGAYTFQLRFTPEKNGKIVESDSDVPSIFTALTEQLGLALKSQKAPVSVLVVDGAEKPRPD